MEGSRRGKWVEKLCAQWGAEGLPFRHAGSFGFDFGAAEWVNDTRHDCDVVRVVSRPSNRSWDEVIGCRSAVKAQGVTFVPVKGRPRLGQGPAHIRSLLNTGWLMAPRFPDPAARAPVATPSDLSGPEEKNLERWDLCFVSLLRRRGTAMILIVEDEYLINQNITEELHSHGCSALSAFNADEAIDILQNRSDVEVVFTDIDMPGSMDGLRLAAIVRDRWPPIQVIVTSGKHVPLALPEKVSFLAKPYAIAEVVRRMEQYCD